AAAPGGERFVTARDVAARGGVRVPARDAQDAAIAAGRDVDIEIEIDLRGAENHRVEHVHDRPALVSLRVTGRGHRLVRRVTPVGIDRTQVEALDVEEATEQAGL